MDLALFFTYALTRWGTFANSLLAAKRFAPDLIEWVMYELKPK